VAHHLALGRGASSRQQKIGSLWIHSKPGERLVRHAVTASHRINTDVPISLGNALCVRGWAL
jgi:hypothetical protein